MKVKISNKDSSSIQEDDTYNISIPKVHDYKLIKDGCKYAEGSVEIEKENLMAALEAALEIDELAEHMIICYREKDKDGWNFGVAIMPLSNFNIGSEIRLNLTGIKKLVVE